MKFSIRDLLWLTLLAAIGASWWIDHARLNAALESALSPGPKLVPAAGIVTLRGRPLDGAAVTVICPGGNSATGITDSQGRFALTFLGRSGALPGKKLVILVSKYSDQPTADGTATKRVNVLPAKYDGYGTSGLTIDIPNGGSKSLAIDLK